MKNSVVSLKSLSGVMVAMLSLLLIMPVQAEIVSMGDAINKAGRQRMLTQRIVKAYCMIGLDVKSDEAKKQLSGAIKLFEQQLAELENYYVNANVSEGLRKVKSLWHGVKAFTSETPNNANAMKLRDKSEELLRAAHEVVLLLQDASGTATGRLVNIAGRQRMLSQRMANLYMMKTMSITGARYSGDFSTAMLEFKGALGELLGAPENTPEITRKLKSVRTQFSMFEYSVKTKSGEFIPGLIAGSSEKILKQMNEITGLYASLN